VQRAALEVAAAARAGQTFKYSPASAGGFENGHQHRHDSGVVANLWACDSAPIQKGVKRIRLEREEALHQQSGAFAPAAACDRHKNRRQKTHPYNNHPDNRGRLVNAPKDGIEQGRTV